MTDARPELDLDTIDRFHQPGAADEGICYGCLQRVPCQTRRLIEALRAERRRALMMEEALRLADRALHVPPFAYNIDRAATLKLRQQARDAVNAALLAARGES